ncbi:retrotransposon protein, putative, ty1-copia subclass [Tanacetum coccineum]
MQSTQNFYRHQYKIRWNPQGIIDDIHQLIRGFLWCNGESIRGKAKVSWDEICLPKKERGLGLRHLDIFNYALMTTHIWNIVSSKESLWVHWIHTYKLRGHSFWDVPVKSDMSWGWRKLLQLRETVKPFFWVKLGNGLSTLLWYDRLSSLCPLITFLSPHDITREGFHLQNKVADLIVNGVWAWPQAWLHKVLDIGTITTPVLDALQTNVTQWRDHNGTLSSFLVAKAWEAIRPRGNQVGWFRIVWFSHNIPCHAFHLWLVMRKGLKTHDRMKQWDVGPTIDVNLLRCSLCNAQPDSHTYLFFECAFSAKVWSYVRVLADMDLVPPVMHDIILYLQPMGSKRTARCIFGKLIVAAAAYFIWLERNNRTFKNVRRSPEEIRDIIMVTVHLKLLSLRFKNTDSVRHLLSRWKMPKNFCIYG